MATKTHKKGAVENLVDSAVGAAEELGQAATAFKESWKHIKKAKSKAAPATRAATRVSKKAWSATKNTAKKMMPGKKKKANK